MQVSLRETCDPVLPDPDVRFTVTPMGGGREALPRIVEGIVRYLQPPPQTTPGADPGGSGTTRNGPGDYYADSGEEPGRWLGIGAATAGLAGSVDADDFASVLAGRDPLTGERLITAQGSAGRRRALGAGNHTRTAPDGRLLFGEDDAATALGVTKKEVSRMLDVGMQAAIGNLASTTQSPGTVPDPVPVCVPVPAKPLVIGSYLVPIVEPDRSRWVTGTELSRCLDDREAGTDPAAVAAAGLPDDQLSIAEAARIAGVTVQYLRGCASRWEKQREQIDADLTAGRRPRRAYLVAFRGTKNRWIIQRQHLAEFLERRRPPAVRVGYDLTLTTEKSLGVLALLSPPEVGRTVLAAIQAGNDHALTWMESVAAAGRAEGHRVAATGWTVASFRHLTSRRLDPFAHHHNVVANSVTLPDGSHRALDARGLYANAQAASALATAEMRRQLTLQLGVRWRPARHGGWEIDGIDDSVITEFSQRRNEIDDALEELEEAIGRGAHPGEVDHIVLKSRPAKNRTPAATLTDGWRARAEKLGLDPKSLVACTGRHIDLAEPDVTAMFESLARPEGICADGSIFSRADAICALADHPVPAVDGETQPLLVGADRLEQLADEFLACSHVIALGEDRYTTAEILDVQTRIADRYAAGQHTGAHLVAEPLIQTALDARPFLTTQQQGLVRAWCQSGSRFQAAIGRAGAGKTTTVAACVDAWEAAGHRVLGAAVKGEAARTLAEATGIRCETVAWYLVQDDPHRPPLDARTILVVDEASTLADRDLDALMRLATTTGASLRLIGDPAQHGAIAAGGMFRAMCEHHARSTPELSESHRLQHPLDRAAADALREGRVDDALDHLAAAGHLHIVDDDLEMYRQVLGRWWDAHLAGEDHPMVDRRNRTRQQLNRLAHEMLRVHGHISSEEIHATGDRRFSVGDRITARAPNRDLHPPKRRSDYIRNGATGTVVAVRKRRKPAKDQLVVDFVGIGVIAVPRSFFDAHQNAGGRAEVGIDHAYALTSYAVQGSTSPRSTSRLDATASRAEAYVDVTRGRSENHLFLTATSDPIDGEHLPRVAPTAADQAVAERLRHSMAERTAWELIGSPASRGRSLE